MQNKINDTQVLMIVGMHRSGTSCLTGSLQQDNLYLGEVHEKNPFNLKGNRENQGIVDLNDAVLLANDSSWDNPPTAPIVWNDNQRNRREELIATMSVAASEHQSKYWGFKDPRSLLTLPFWQEGIIDLNFVGTFRHPLSVAKSLMRRSQMPVEEAIILWRKYNIALLELWKKEKFPILCFDVSNEKYLDDLSIVYEALGFELTDSSPSFFNADLRKNNQHMIDCKLPQEVTAIYDELSEIYNSQFN